MAALSEERTLTCSYMFVRFRQIADLQRRLKLRERRATEGSVIDGLVMLIIGLLRPELLQTKIYWNATHRTLPLLASNALECLILARCYTHTPYLL